MLIIEFFVITGTGQMVLPKVLNKLIRVQSATDSNALYRPDDDWRALSGIIQWIRLAPPQLIATLRGMHQWTLPGTMLNVLDMAVLYNRVDLIEHLKDLDIDFNYSNKSLGHTALGVACYLGNIDMIVALVSSGAHPTGGELGLALKGGHIEVVEHMLSLCVKPRVSDLLGGIRSGASVNVLKVGDAVVHLYIRILY
jgi:hypothetical protein